MDPDPSCFITLINFGSAELIYFVLILILLTCSGLISACEEALFSLDVSDFPDNREDYTANQKIIIKLLDRPKRLLATILIADTFFNIGTVLLSDHLSDILFGHIEMVLFGVNMQFILKVIVVTFILLLFGEILPKIYGIRKKVEIANLMVKPLFYFDKALSVFSMPLNFMASRIERRLGNHNNGLSVDQLSQALDLADERDTTAEEQEILQSIVSFGNTETRQVMQPRTDVFALNVTQHFQEILPELVDRGYSRIPVYEDSLDNVVGILYIKDLLPYLDKSDFEWQSLMRAPYFVPENKKLDDLLTDFKAQKNHLAIVVDEYGGTSGLISMEDIIEEIVGEISDEFDDVDIVFSKLDEHTFVFEGKTPLIDFFRITKLEDVEIFEDQKGDSETIAGLLLEVSGNLPKLGEEIKFENYTFTVEAVDDRRIKQVKFSKT